MESTELPPHVARLIELERERAARKALDSAASMLEGYSTNEQYRKAFKLGADLIRAKRETFVSETYTDKSENTAHEGGGR